MSEWGSEGHTRRQLLRSRPHYGQRRKLSHLDEVSKQRCTKELKIFLLWISAVLSLNSKTQKEHGKGTKKRKKEGLGFAKASTPQCPHLAPQTQSLKTSLSQAC